MEPVIRHSLVLATKILGDISITIAAPVIVLAFAGKAADQRFGTAPFLLIGGFVAAALITVPLVRRKAERYAREYEALTKSEPPTRP